MSRSATKSIAFNAQHSPIGAFASFTLGLPGANGGLGLELGGPANENVFIGLESATENAFDALPFFAGIDDDRERYEADNGIPAVARTKVRAFPLGAIERTYSQASDCWRAGDLAFTIYSPVRSVPDPAKGPARELKATIAPAVIAELVIDNRRGRKARTAFFGYQGGDPYTNMRRLDDTAKGKFVGVGQGTHAAIVSRDRGVYSGLAFLVEDLLRPEVPENLRFGLGGIGALMVTVPAGKKRTVRFAVCFYRHGEATSGMSTRYFYSRYFNDIEAVADFALEHAPTYKKWATEADRELTRSSLNDDQKFMLAHTVHSYYGSTQFLDAGGEPFWVVNEGEYRMMNTFDLTVDQLYFEMKMNPWTVRNELDWFVKRFSYRDKARLPGDATEYPGGLSFTHDMGIGNVVSRPGYSSYEQFGLTGCFSHMTHEELVNWVCCALVYCAQTNDRAWRNARLSTFAACLTSMINRDHPDPKQRNGIMALDSSRCLGGSEITTYDSLDESLGQARNNLYLAVKCWGAYVGLASLFADTGKPALSRRAAAQAARCADTICSHADAKGMIPAVMGEGVDSRIIPAVEGLVFPHVLGLDEALSEAGPYGHLVAALRKHLKAILKPGICIFPDGGWKLSSTSINSWLSKIYLCQFVARKVLGLDLGAAGRRADAAHVKWLKHPDNAYYAWSDQIYAGIAKGSKYYPRGVTSILWLEE